jgi:hypothetical protein
MNKNFVIFTRYLTLLLATLVLFTNCKKEVDFDNLDLLEKIKRLDGVTVVEIEATNNYPRTFQIDLVQPVDHNNPEGAKFIQRIYLLHMDEKMPMVFAPNGYGCSSASNQEIARILQTNCLNVTHRYFPEARPDPLNWQYLTIEQAAADHHRIVQLFKKIYKGKWISSGASKSGLTSLFHKRFYPDDVDATIAYVAPFTIGLKDEKFPIYLSGIGGSECFSKLKQIQLYVLDHRVEMLSFIDDYIKSGTYTYSLDRELLLELDIMDYPFTFWQYFSIDCSLIPDTTTSTALQIFQHYTGIVPPYNFSDENLSYYEPYVYQAITELGAPAYQTDYLVGHLKKVDPGASGNPNYEMVGPKGVSYTFQNNTIPGIYEWLQNYGNKIIYIYGKNDPWSAGAIDVPETTDALLFMQEGANHRIKIADLDQPELVYAALERWLGITIDATSRKSFNPEEDLPGFRLGGIREQTNHIKTP